MKFYVTAEGIPKLKKVFLNLKIFSIIDVDKIIEDFGYTDSIIDDYGCFIISNKIKTLIKNYSKSVRIRGIIYVNSKLTNETILNLKENVDTLTNIREFVLLDDYNVPKLKHFYQFFNEIVYFPYLKKIRLIECKSIEDKIKWKN